ncbi:S8 family serine peptidase [Zhouia amylolytica]|uniref:Subtilisin-like serine protease n=1 Tax=Zhouia amylolytica AD3 TaxID=1286632 RepID=W2US85_9FLAO|nr:S8 family serine peptidase [Zhouia amylolytica]ETN97035.1 hypothetical protein P278_04610 [Zhouia amylolytica AD3]
MKWILLFFLIIVSKAYSFQEHARVYFKDKPNASALLENPSTILSARSIERKKAHNVLIDHKDVPVHDPYIAAVANREGITVHAKSKWFNCIHVTGSVTAIKNLNGLSFVGQIVFVNKRLNDGEVLKSRSESQRIYKNKFDKETIINSGYTSAQLTQIGVPELHNAGFRGEGILIAVLDAGFPGVDFMEAFRKLRMGNGFLNSYDFVDRTSDISSYKGNQHGTLVLSTMAAYLKDIYMGSAPDASYVLFRTEEAEQETPVEESYWVEAAERADSLGVDIINTSLGYSTFDNPDYSYFPEEMDGQTTFISKGAGIALDKGMLLVTSAGNEGNNLAWEIVTAPADADVLTVGAVDAEGNYASFSSRGPTADLRVKPDVMAQGVATAVILPDDSMRYANGTSFSSPVVAGAVACLWQANPSLSNEAIIQLVRKSGHLYDHPNNLYGFGIPNLGFWVAGANFSQEIASVEFSVFPNPTSGKFEVVFPEQIKYAEINLYDILGKWVFNKDISSRNNQINIAHLNSGVYIAKITSKNAEKTLKIIKQ